MGHLQKLQSTWINIWFQNKSTTPLEIIRIGVGSLMFLCYAFYSPADLASLYGDQGYISKESISAYIDNPRVFSALYYTTQDWHISVLHLMFLSCCLLFTIGWRTAWVKWLVFFGHLSFVHRNPIAFYGVDNILASMMFLMCLAPVGLNLSMDRVRKIRNLKKIKPGQTLSPVTSRWAFACTRLLQLQMATLYFYAGIGKLEGTSWWSGEALWVAINNHHTAFVSPWFFAHNFWLVNLLTYGTVILELAYPFLIWGQKTRPTTLTLALLLHTGIALVLGLHLFAAAMILGHLAFMRNDWLVRWGQAWKGRVGQLELVYDENCVFCKNSMSWLLAFDGLAQIIIRKSPGNVSPHFDKHNTADAIVSNENNVYPGFEAIRYMVARVPGMWWLAPWFYIPFFSRTAGPRVFDWVNKKQSVPVLYVTHLKTT